MSRPVLPFVLISVLSVCALAAKAGSGRGAVAAVDAARDARLGARVRLRVEAIPLRRVFRALAEETAPQS